MSEEIPITIIGGGVVGCAIAYELSKNMSQQVVLLDQNPRIPGENQSSRNSGVVHAGIYYRKDTAPLKARFCVEGNKMIYEFCEEFGVPYSKTGKLVVATNEREEEYLNGTFLIAQENGVPNIKKIDGIEARLMEPNVKATSALYVPTSGIVESATLTRKLRELSVRGAHILPEHKVVNIMPRQRGFTVTVESRGKTETYETRMLINSAGLYADEIARMVNSENSHEIIPIRLETGKFSKVSNEALKMKGMNVYPTPRGLDPIKKQILDIPYAEFERLYKQGKASSYVGVHLTPTLDFVNDSFIVGDVVTIGPVLTPVNGKEDLGQNRLNREAYHRSIESYFPNIKKENITHHQVGIMAKLKGRNDFVIERDQKFPDCINLIGIDSPGLTASLAIAKYVREILKD